MPHTDFINDRLRFLEIDAETIATIREAKAILEPQLEPMLDRFYEHILAAASLRGLFQDDASIERARSGQKNHWLLTLFDGLLDSDYFNKAERIGRAHARVGLMPSWYIGGYCQMLGQCTQAIMQHDGIDNEKASSMIRAIQKAVFLDMDVVIHCYLDVKDETMQDVLRRATIFTDDVKNLSAQIGETAESVRAMSETGGNPGERAESLVGQAEKVLQQTASLRSRLDEFKTGDRLYIADAAAQTGTIAKLKALFYSGRN